MKTWFFVLALPIVLLWSAAMAESYESVDKRNVRYLTWNVPQVVLDGMVSLDIDNKTSSDSSSKKINDYDALIVFLDGWSDIENLIDAEKLGVNIDKIRNTSDSVLFQDVATYFKESSAAFHVILVHKGNFLDREENCYGPLMLDILIGMTSGSEIERFPVEKYRSCASGGQK